MAQIGEHNNPMRNPDMSAVSLIERDITKAELDRMRAGFAEHQIEHGNPVKPQERYGFVALAGERFIGCASGLTDNNWFYLSDLWIERAYRGQGLGAALLGSLEARVAALAIRNVYTWTAAYEAPRFYKRQGYEFFASWKAISPQATAALAYAKR